MQLGQVLSGYVWLGHVSSGCQVRPGLAWIRHFRLG
jgi:hypothetical protein